MAEYISFQPTDFFNPKLYTGTGSSLGVTGVGFQPDLTWIKQRNSTGNHYIADAARGAGKYVEASTNIAQVDNINGLSAFDADGFTVGTQGSQVNGSSDTYVSWNWKAGTTSGLTGGTITPSSYSINTTSGCGIYKYAGNSTSGATIAHGLGVAPSTIWIKNLDITDDWQIYHVGMGNTKYLEFNTSDAAGTATNRWNDTSPTSTVFSLGNYGGVNTGSDYVAYAFADVRGYSRMGVYTGNGNADGTFVYLGFRPAFLIVKEQGGTNNWTMFDNKRNPFWNPTAEALQPNSSAGEYDETDGVDFLSNGFKTREAAAWLNSDGQPILYIAFAAFPIVSSNDVPVVAR